MHRSPRDELHSKIQKEDSAGYVHRVLHEYVEKHESVSLVLSTSSVPRYITSFVAWTQYVVH